MSKQGRVATVFEAIDKFSKPVRAMSAANSKFATNVQASAMRAQRGLNSFASSANGAFNSMFNLRNLLVAGAVGMAAKQFYSMASETAKAGDEIGKTSRQIGISAEALQEYRYVAERQGVSQEAITNSFLKLNKTLGEAKVGQGTLVTALKNSNPELLKQLQNAENSEQAFDVMVKAISKAPNQFEKTRLATSAFGRAGVDMLKIMEAGEGGISDLRAEANRLGFVMSTEATQAAEKFADSQLNMERAIDGVKMRIGVALIPQIEKVINKITNWTTTNKDLINTKVTEFIGKIISAVTWLVKHSDKIILAFKIIAGAMIVLKVAAFLASVASTAIGIYSAAVKAVTYAQWLWNAAMAANPIGLIIAAIIALIALVAAAIVYWDDWGAAVMLFLGPIGMLISFIKNLYDNWEKVTEAFKSGGILEGLKMIGRVFIASVLQPFEQLLKLASNIPGMSWAGEAAKGIEAFRNDMIGNEQAAPEVANPTATAQNQIIERTSTNNARVDLNVNDPTGRTTASSDQDFVKINTTSTFAFQ